MKGNKTTTIALLLIFILGLSLLLYPSFSNYINKLHQTAVSNEYIDGVAELEEEDYDEIFAAAENYNRKLNARTNGYALPNELEAIYDDMLKVPGTDVMAIIDIPFLGVSLPVYHGTSDPVLQRSVGHIEWSSLPIGGTGTHAVLCGHRGLPSSRLFTDLDKLAVGDIFTITVLDRLLTYEVDQIRIVEPEDVKDLSIVKGEDYCTLQTCTPYGINTHRLLVRGHRIKNLESGKAAAMSSEGIEIEPLIVAPILSVPLLIALFVFAVLYPAEKTRRRINPEENHK